MKRNISVTVSLLLISFSLLLLFTSCEKHVHTFGEWSTVLEPTCSAEGRQERTCECGEKETQPIEALPHTVDKWINEIIATTMNKGVQSSNCTVCQAPLIRELPQRVTKYLTYTVNADGVTCTITGREYFDNETELGIPEEIDGYKVTAIGDYAFDNKLFGYSHLYIPEGVTHIGKGAFSGTPLKHAHLPNSLVYIGESALGFSTSGYYNLYKGGLYLGNEENPYVVLIAPYNYDVKTCEIHPDTKFIASQALSNWANLSSITIPDNVVQIGKYAFSGCTGLTSVKLPKHLTEISESLFRGCTSLNTVEIPEGVTKIGQNAFYGCKNLKSVEFNSKLKTIEQGAFLGCDSLWLVDLPDSLRSIGASAFEGCQKFYEITIPEGVETIEANAFARCSNLKAVFLPDSLKAIKQNAFYKCHSLEIVIIPDSLEELGTNAFGEVNNLILNEYKNGFYLGNAQNPYLILMHCNAGWPTFRDFSETTKFIYDGALRIRTNIREVTLPEGLLQIGANAFSGCIYLSKINFPESLKYIGDGAFGNCHSLEEVLLVKNVEYIGNSAFKDCMSIKNVLIVGHEAEIKWGAFYGNTELKALDIFEGVEFIDDYTFYGCESLETVNLPATLKEIGNLSFAYASKLKDINYNGTKEQWEKIKKDENWDWTTGSYTVHCTDGDIEK